MKNIPNQQLPEIYANAQFIDEKFVKIKENNKIVIEMQYPILKMKNSEFNCLVRDGVAQRLYYAASLLPNKYRFKILDAWRPFALQKELYETYKERIISDFNLLDLSEEEKNKFISRYVSVPSDDINIPPVHTTGGAIDLTIIDENGTELAMGTGFDAFSEKTNTVYFEGINNEIIRNNRRLLYYTMIKAGFTNLPSEWWHFDYGDRFWAYYTNNPAIYRGVFFRGDMNEE